MSVEEETQREGIHPSSDPLRGSSDSQSEELIRNYLNYLIIQQLKVPDIFFKKISEFLIVRNEASKTEGSKEKKPEKKLKREPEGRLNFQFFYDEKYKNTERYIVV